MDRVAQSSGRAVGPCFQTARCAKLGKMYGWLPRLQLKVSFNVQHIGFQYITHSFGNGAQNEGDVSWSWKE
jgi:hypothetical protein